MAIYHFHAETISRANSHHAVAAAAYRRCIKLKDERTQRIHDYSQRNTAVYSELSLPDNAPSWIQAIAQMSQNNPEQAIGQLWNLVEKTENRKDAQLSREVRLALPIELGALDNIALVRDFVTSQFTSQGMLADWSIHFDLGNPHVHILLSLRELTPEGFGLKIREWNSKALLNVWRQRWAEIANQHLLNRGIDARIDHRSYIEQGIDLVPTYHMGKKITEQEKRGIETERLQLQRDVQAENLRRIQEMPSRLTETLSRQSDTFSSQKLIQTLARYIHPHDESFTPFSAQFLQEKQDDIAMSLLTTIPSKTSQQTTSQRDLLEKVLATLEHHEAVFSERDVARVVSHLTPHADLFASTLAQIKAELHHSPHVFNLGVGDDGRLRFTTKKLFDVENEIQRLTENLHHTKHKGLSDKLIQKALANHENQTGKTLTDEQQQALFHLTQPNKLVCLVGRAGTGKSFTVGAVKHVYTLAGFDVKGVALSGIASNGLNRDAGIPSQTIESFKFALENNPHLLHEKSVLIMDEAGMTDSLSMQSVLKAVDKAKAKLILLGDPDQLQPVGPGAVFRAMLERLGFSEIQTIYRQWDTWQREASLHLSRGETDKALSTYNEKGCVHLEQTETDAFNHLVADWLKTLEKSQDLSQQLVIAYRNQDVQTLNHRLRQSLIEKGLLAEGYTVNTQKGHLSIAQGDRLLFLKNKKWLGIYNGSFGTIQSVDFLESGKVRTFTVQIDGQEKPVTIDPQVYADFDYGYCATVHKTQGMTKSYTFAYVAGLWDRTLTYVALTRHRLTCAIYASEENYGTLDKLKETLSHLTLKDSILNFPLSFAHRRGITPKTDDLRVNLFTPLKNLHKTLSDSYQQWKDPKAYQQSTVYQETVNAREQLRQDAMIVAQYADCRLEVGSLWQTLSEQLKVANITPNTPQATVWLKTQSDYALLQKKIIERDKLAALIHPNADYHARAIELNRIPVADLAKQAKAHNYRSTVERYQSSHAMMREKMAYQLLKDIQGYYPYLKQADLSTTQLTHQARDYFKKSMLASLPLEERSEQRQAFAMVERYLGFNQTIAKHWRQYDITQQNKEEPNPTTRLNALFMEKLARERDKLAHTIVHQDSYAMKTACAFYSIGEIASWYGQRTTLDEKQRAIKQQEILTNASTRHEAYQTVEDYLTLKSAKDPKALSLAHTMVQSAKRYHGAMVALSHKNYSIQALWQAVRWDAKRHRFDENIRTLTHKERLIYFAVERYIEAKKSHATAWREVFDAKAGKYNVPLSRDNIDRLMTSTQPYTALRNQLASQLLDNPACQSALLDAGIEFSDLKTQTYAHQCQERVFQYHHEQNRLKKSAMAVQIAKDPKGHWQAMKSLNIDYSTLYTDVRLAERKQRFDRMTPLEKRFYRLSARYKKANQDLGKTYGQLKSISWQNRTDKQPLKLSRLSERRNHLANQLMILSTVFEHAVLPSLYQENRLNLSKLKVQAHQHTIACQRLKTAQETTNVQAVHHVALSAEKYQPKKYHEYRQERHIDLIRLREDLKAKAEDIATYYLNPRLGQPKVSYGQLRYGKKGSLAVTFNGSKEGLWYDYESGIGGDMFKLIQQETGGDFKQTLQESLNFLGGASLYENVYQTVSDSVKKNTEKEQQATLEEAKKQAHIKEIAKDLQPIQGTLAEKYLTEHRAITQSMNNNNLRFHPALKNWSNGQTYPAFIV